MNRTGRIREFQREDIPEVSDLWFKVFRKRQTPGPELLRDYFSEIFFDSPLRDKNLPSLVYEDKRRCIVGFLGILSRTMALNKQPVTVATATQ